MKTFGVCILFAFLTVGLALPQYEVAEDGGWRTWTAIKNFFRPMTTWFSEELPMKSPSDIADDVQDTAVEIRNWAENNPVIQGVGEAVKPIGDWVQDGYEYVKDKPFRTIYGDVKETVNDVDETVGGWLDSNVG